MSAQYVCPSCRRHVVRRAVALQRPQRASSSFVSFTSNNPRSPSSQNKPSASATPDAEPDPPKQRATPDQRLRDVLPPAARPSAQTRRPRPSSSDALTNLFSVLGKSDAPGRYSGSQLVEKDVRRPQPAPQRPAHQIQRPEQPPREPDAMGLQDILQDDKKTLKEAWEYFEAHYDSPDCRALKTPLFQDVALLHSGVVFSTLLNSMVSAWSAGDLDPTLPSPTQLVERYLHLKIMRAPLWNDLLWTMSTNALKKFDTPPAENPTRPFNEILAELMMAWNHLFKHSARAVDTRRHQSATSQGPGASREMWDSLPPLVSVRQVATGINRQLDHRLGAFLRDIPVPLVGRIVNSALVTYDMLTREEIASKLGEDSLANYKPFVEFLAHLIPRSNLEVFLAYMQTHLEQREFSAEEISALYQRLRDSPKNAHIIAGLSRVSAEEGQELASTAEQLEVVYKRHIARAYDAEKAPKVYELWQRASKNFPRQEGNSNAPDIPPSIYNLAIEALMGLRRQEQAIQVWNAMIGNGVRPTIKTWTSMLTGCGRARDMNGLEQIWQKMLASGVPPDAHAWSARICGILHSGRIQQGLQILEEMGKSWAEAYKRAEAHSRKKGLPLDESSLPVKPNTEILNGVVTVLSRNAARRGRETYLARVLAWGNSFGIKPDVVTFNALISMSLQRGNAQEAMKLLQQMEQLKLEPDVATFAIILNSIFRSSDVSHATPEEQQQKVISVLKSLEERGLEANAVVFSTLIDGLVKVHQNLPAAKAVLHHMESKQIPLSPHIYTILMTHYFAQEEPDYAAIEALWYQIQASDAVVDVIFYDRMIERYAEVGNTGQMMAFLQHMSKDGLSPGWPALEAVVRQLARIEDWDRLEEFVNDVTKGVGIAKKGIRPSAQHVENHFWYVAESALANRPRRGGVLPTSTQTAADGPTTATSLNS